VKVHVVSVDAGIRRVLIASSQGVLILSQRRRRVGRASAWIILGCHLVAPDDVPYCAPDVRDAFEAERSLALPEGA